LRPLSLRAFSIRCNPLKGIGLIATWTAHTCGARSWSRTLQSPEGDWADCDGLDFDEVTVLVSSNVAIP